MNIALFRKRIDESVIARTQSEAKRRGRSNLTRKVIPSTFALLSVNCTRNLREGAPPVPSTDEVAPPRNDTACRIATLPLVARKDHGTTFNAFAVALWQSFASMTST